MGDETKLLLRDPVHGKAAELSVLLADFPRLFIFRRIVPCLDLFETVPHVNDYAAFWGGPVKAGHLSRRTYAASGNITTARSLDGSCCSRNKFFHVTLGVGNLLLRDVIDRCMIGGMQHLNGRCANPNTGNHSQNGLELRFHDCLPRFSKVHVVLSAKIKGRASSCRSGVTGGKQLGKTNSPTVVG